MRSKLLAILIIMSAMITTASGKKPRTIANGSWGGQHIQMTVTNGSATIEYDCANGSITGPLKIDSRGRFTLLGKHVREHGGPVRIDENREGVPARYTGWTDGKTMKLTVRLVKPNTEIGTFELTLGGASRIRKCR